jgi:hypothetical protein
MEQHEEEEDTDDACSLASEQFEVDRPEELMGELRKVLYGREDEAVEAEDAEECRWEEESLTGV